MRGRAVVPSSCRDGVSRLLEARGPPRHTRNMSALTYEDSIQELSRRIAERRAALESERVAAESQCIRLQKLLEIMKTMTDVFDAEDCSQVQAQVAGRVQQLQSLRSREREEEQQRKEKEQLFRSMLTAIDARAQLLEQDDECLNENPEMLQFFARKQMNLRALLQLKIDESLGAPAQPRQEQRLENGSHP